VFHWLYETFYDPEGWLSFFRLFRYVTSRSIFAVVTAFVLTLVAGRRVIRFLYRHDFREAVRDYGVLDIESKRGTPTMGGVILVAAALLSGLLWCDLSSGYALLPMAAMVWFFGLGAADDLLKTRRGHSDKGLSRGAKYLLQIAFGLGLGVIFLNPATSPVPAGLASRLFVPFYKHAVADLSWAYLLVVVITVVFTSNAINFADGLDGLAIVPSSFVVVVYAVFAYVLGNTIWSEYLQFEFLPGSQEVTVFCAALFGAGIGFLWFNAYPAEVFMGDAGSMALGGTIGTMAVLLKQEVLFLVAGGVFLAEIVSVVIQDWIGIQRLGRRILFRAPLHHTFQYRGLAETKIAVRFWIVSGVLSLIALASLKVR
jgi:phospho-N-acetylmuramoyl-pentapeptide-transferase